MNISAVLLAGGESRRMGKDKATLLFRGQPLWQIQLSLLRKLKPQEIFVSARTDPAWRPNDVSFIADEAPSRGPLSGLAAALAQTRTDHLLALAIDMPFMTEEFLRSLCRDLQKDCGIIPQTDQRAEPLAAIYPREVHVDLTSALKGGDFSLQSLTNTLVQSGKVRLLPVPPNDRELFRSLNYPEDLDGNNTRAAIAAQRIPTTAPPITSEK